MFAMLSTATGGPETLELTELPSPEPQAGEIRVAVRAAGVNFPDTLMIRDLYQFRPERPFAPGGEIAGVVEALGEGVTGLAVGDRVLALTMHGGFTTEICIPAANAVKFPEAMPFDEAAAFIFTYGTSIHGLKDRGRVKPGETVLVLGAAGGIGSSAVELAKAMGARVIAAVSSPEKAEFCRSIGADETVIYPREMDRAAQKAFGGEIKHVAGKAGVDVVYDAVGGDYAEPALRCLNWEGRYLVVGFPAGIPTIPLNLPLLKGCEIVGVFWGAFTMRDPAAQAENMADLLAFYADAKIKPRITARYPLAEAAKALADIEERRVQGKIVLMME